jgi:predicted dehydrogenase
MEGSLRMGGSARTRVGFIGMGVMARYHLGDLLDRSDTEVAAICEPSAAASGAAAEQFVRRGLPVPPNEPDWLRFVATYADQLDAIFIITPHVLHFAQATACLEAGIDVLLEKPMVMTADEATALIRTRDRTGRLLVVAFQGSLSSQIREASRRLRSGELGKILNVNAMVWQNWGSLTSGGWRQDPGVAGGGFLFDTGAHMLNTVMDLVGEDLAEVAAWLEEDGHPVDVRAVVMGRTVSGALVTMNACGSAIPSCHSDIRVFTSRAILRTGVWGETLELQRAGTERLRKVRSLAPVSVWQQFLNIRDGRTPNPSPPEAGLRMARLWDAIRESAAGGGAVIANPTASPVGASHLPAADASPVVAAGQAPRIGVEVVGR